MINMLKQSLIIKEEELKKANENLKWFKLEIVNREGNYNKLFNANPNVGVLNPLDQTKVIDYNNDRGIVR